MRLEEGTNTVLTKASKMHLYQNGAAGAEVEVWSDRHQMATYQEIKKRRPDAPYHSMRELYGTEKGKTVFVCGSGPSLTQSPSKLPGTTFAINRAITHVQADYWCFADMEAFRQHGTHENAKAAKTCFGSGLHLFFPDTPAYLIEAVGTPARYTKEAERPLYWNLSTFSWALHLAVKTGAARVVCVGCDYSLDRYHDGYEPKGYEGLMDKLFLVSLDRMREMFGPDKAEWFDPSVEILDASGGNLPVRKTRLEDWL